MLDRPVLVSNLVAGVAWLVLLAGLGPWPLALAGAAYVVGVSLGLAAFYGRGSPTLRREALAWTASWLLAVALWTCLLAPVEGGTSGYWVPSLAGALVLGTGCFLAWQVSALAFRQAASLRPAPRPPRRSASTSTPR